ncbi:dixin-A-like isoform X1 [Uloborus diversus]|uniref:dixin-A-like isoform X1 n=1 Tax=Uloborus diversus TaxID=327109 RepID=UPI00240A96D9|nr:dixin-A-like isoform X1 [Uloborus diversus]
MKLKRTIEEQEQEIARLKLSISSQAKNFKYPYSAPARMQHEELQVVAEALGSLRRCFPANDSRQHTLDTVEQSLAALLERINALEMSPPSALVSSPTLRKSLYERDATSITAHVQDETSEKQLVNSNSTKVVYYMDKSLTPFRCIMHKRIGEATLRDFKILFDRPGQYRYHFKTLDPEFGMVKEEVLHDDDILPGWDSKIVAWIEEDCS